jgi:hypothetical protein
MPECFATGFLPRRTHNKLINTAVRTVPDFCWTVLSRALFYEPYSACASQHPSLTIHSRLQYRTLIPSNSARPHPARNEFLGPPPQDSHCATLAQPDFLSSTSCSAFFLRKSRFFRVPCLEPLNLRQFWSPSSSSHSQRPIFRQPILNNTSDGRSLRDHPFRDDLAHQDNLHPAITEYQLTFRDNPQRATTRFDDFPDDRLSSRRPITLLGDRLSSRRPIIPLGDRLPFSATDDPSERPIILSATDYPSWRPIILLGDRLSSRRPIILPSPPPYLPAAVPARHLTSPPPYPPAAVPARQPGQPAA